MESKEGKTNSGYEDSEEDTEEDHDYMRKGQDLSNAEADLSPGSEKQKKRSRWKKLTSTSLSRDKGSKKDRGKEEMKGKGKENVEMVDMDDRETSKDNRKSLGKLNIRERGLFKKPSLKDYRKKWKSEGGERRRRIESPASSKEETKFHKNGNSPSNNNNNNNFDEERRHKKWSKTTTGIDDESPQIRTFEQSNNNITFGGIVEGAGNDKMMWARRAFFMSTEKIFPGFIRNYGLRSNRSRDPTGVKLRTSIPLKMILLAHSYFVPIWFIAFLCLQEFAANSLKPLHNYVHTTLTYVCMVTDALRLYGGFVSNTRDDMQLLALYWMATVILQTPMMCFIFATHSFSVHVLILNSTMDIILASILVLEIWFGFWQLRGLVNSEIHLLHMARQMQDMQIMNDRPPRVVNSTQHGPSLNWPGSSDNDEDHNSETKGVNSPNRSILIAKNSGTMDIE